MTQAAVGFAGAPPSSSSMSPAVSEREPCLFQFPATMGRRMEQARLGLTGLKRARDDSDSGGVTQRCRSPAAAPPKRLLSGGGALHDLRELGCRGAGLRFLAPFDHD